MVVPVIFRYLVTARMTLRGAVVMVMGICVLNVLAIRVAARTSVAAGATQTVDVLVIRRDAQLVIQRITECEVGV